MERDERTSSTHSFLVKAVETMQNFDHHRRPSSDIPALSLGVQLDVSRHDLKSKTKKKERFQSLFQTNCGRAQIL
jgi:hypothetical protein